MFKLTKANPEFTHTVHVQVPVDGGHREETLKCRFRALPADALSVHDTVSEQGTDAYLRAICVRFEDVVDDDGNPIPQSDELTNMLLGLSYVRMALIRTYTAAMIKARLGN
jgi:hypothetical protein